MITLQKVGKPMKKYGFLFAINALILGAVAINALVAIVQSCGVGLTCANAVSPMTWTMAIAPLLVIVGVALRFTPAAIAGLRAEKAERQQDRAIIKQERAAVQAAQAAVDESAQSRLRRVSRNGDSDEPTGDDGATPEIESEDDEPLAMLVGARDEAAVTAPNPEWRDHDEDDHESEDDQIGGGEQPDSWGWLWTQGPTPQLRPASETGFPWVAAMISETASAVLDRLSGHPAGEFDAEADAWLTITAQMPSAQPITGSDGQEFVGWVNDLLVHCHMMNIGVSIDALIGSAMMTLSERADDDDALAASLPARVYDGHGFADIWAKAS